MVFSPVLLFLVILEKRILTDAILATEHFHAVRLTLRKPLIDSLNVYSRKVSGLLWRQHLAIKPADMTVRSRQPLDDPFLLEKSNLNSSSFCCGHGWW